MRHCGWLLGLLSLFSLATHASDWQGKVKMRPGSKPSGLTHGAAIPQLTAISTGLAAR